MNASSNNLANGGIPDTIPVIPTMDIVVFPHMLVPLLVLDERIINGINQALEGSKMVLLITGKCTCACFYCPLSKKKYGKDVIYADEWQLKNEKDTHILIEEAHAIDAEGAGITGGDPLLVWQRTREYITILKKEFGSSFHIHLYTSGLVHPNHISDLIKAGLDEIRFHPPPSTWNTLSSSPIVQTIYQSVKSTIDVALEIPVLPNHE